MDISVKNIWKSYGEQIVLEDFSCEIPEGKTTCIMGESGCGKTTLMNLLLGLTKPDKGQILGLPEGKIRAVFQENRLCENLSAAANLRLVCRKRPSDEELAQAFQAVRLEGIGKKPVCELSGGMRRRVAILRALIVDAECILMDEPLKGLDEDTRKQTIGYIRRCTQGKTLIVVTHDEREAVLLGAEGIIRM